MAFECKTILKNLTEVLAKLRVLLLKHNFFYRISPVYPHDRCDSVNGSMVCNIGCLLFKLVYHYLLNFTHVELSYKYM